MEPPFSSSMEDPQQPPSSSATSSQPPPPPPPQQPPSMAEPEEEDDDDNDDDDEEEEDEEEEEEDEDEALISKAQKFMELITSSPDNPNPKALHALASLLESQESRYMEEADHSSANETRASHSIGRLGNLIRENDDFFELISSKFLSESRYSISIQAAAARVLVSCSLTWMYPHVFEDDVTENIKNWVLEDNTRYAGDDGLWKRQFGETKCSDFDMRKTYSIGLLALCLTSGSQVIEEVLTSGLSAKLMRYLRNRFLGETSSSQKDAGRVAESKSVSLGGVGKSRDESRARSRPTLENASLDDSRVEDGGSVDQGCERILDKSFTRQLHGEERVVNGEPPDGLAEEEVDIYDADIDEDRRCGRDMQDGRLKTLERNGPGKCVHDEDSYESEREDSSRRRVYRGWVRSRGKTRINEPSTDPEQLIVSPGSVSRGGMIRSNRERSSVRNLDGKRVMDNKKSSNRTIAEDTTMEREDIDECIQECRVGSKDISDLVKAAVRAAEAEARAANAPPEAVEAAGEAAAELVKSTAMDVFKSTTDEEAAFLAASKASSTVIDAANATEVSRNPDDISTDLPKDGAAEVEANEDVEFFIPDSDALAKQREKFCIQCLVILGEYVEVLGPVLHEKGVDVSLALLQRYSDEKQKSDIVSSLPDVLKLICALAAHRKFAAVFLDRGGIQKLLAVPRVLHTFFGLSSCLFTIASLQGIMERVCALPSDVIFKLVELGLQLLECPQDQARKNAALFFAAAFVFRAVLDVFDSQDGLQKSLGLLHDAASVRSGVNSGTLGASAPGALRNDRSNADVLTSSEKQIAYHTCVALRQYFRGQLLLLVDTIRPTKSNRSTSRNIPSSRAAYKPLDLSNEAIDAVFLQIQKDRKLGPALVRARWPAVERFLACNGHVTMLELCQAPPVERYLHDLLQYALGILHVVTLVPYSRKLIVNATLSNDRVGIAVILDAANGPGFIDPDIIRQALNVLINLVCPPPSISNKSPLLAQNPQSASVQTSNASTEGRDRNVERNVSDRAVPVPGHSDARDRNASVQTSNASTEARDRNAERNVSDRVVPGPSQIEARERNGEPSMADRGSSVSNTMQSPSFSVASGLVGDRRISLGAGAGCAGLAAQLEQGYRQAREAVRSNNGIKVLLQLLQTRVVLPPATLDCLRALACRALLGLARDDTIAHILTKLQVGKKLSEVIRDLGNQNPGTEQNRWQTELTQAAIELIAIVTNSGRASTLAATDAATPTLRRIERAAIAAATPIAYHSRELLLLIHEHLQACGLSSSAATLIKEAQLTPLPSFSTSSSLAQHACAQEMPSIQIQWPSGRAPGGFLSNRSKMLAQNEELLSKYDSAVSLKKKPVLFSSSFSARSKGRPSSTELQTPLISKTLSSSRRALGPSAPLETPSTTTSEMTDDAETHAKTPIVLPMKRKLTELKDIAPGSSAKRMNTVDHGLKSPGFQTPNSTRRGGLLSDLYGSITPSSSVRDLHGRQTPLAGQVDGFDDHQYSDAPSSSFQPRLLSDSQPVSSERLTLDSIVVQYLKHQHRQCPAPITTLPPLSLLHPHVCPEPRRSLDAPSNVTARLSTREFRSMYGGIHGTRKDRQFVYSRFRPWRTCRDDAAALLTCMTFLGDSSQIAAGSHSGELKIFDTNSNNILENCTSHQTSLLLVQSYSSNGTHLVLSSSSHDVKLWDASSISGGPIQTFEGCKAARFGRTGTCFGALPTDSSQREILLYDVATKQLDQKFSDPSSGPSGRSGYPIIHFNPSDTLLLWNGILWDRRISGLVHRFEQFSDYGGGGFHPAGNEVIMNTEVWDLRNFKLLRNVPSLDQTNITFNSSGDVIYATLRRNFDDLGTAFHTRRSKHALFSAFRTLDAVNYSDIATIPVDRCVLDFATEPTDSFVGLVTMDDQADMYSSARVYEIGRRRPPDDDSDPDDVESEEDDDDDDDDDDDVDLDPILGPGFDGDGGSDGGDMSNDDSATDDDDDDDDDGDFLVDGAGFEVGGGILDIVTEGDEDDSDMMGSYSSGDEFV